jgi:hypothetical protein
MIFLSLLVLSVVSWLVLRVSSGSGIGSWVTQLGPRIAMVVDNA